MFLSQALVVARKEITDHMRDVRPMLSSLAYALMGPVVLAMVSFSISGKEPAASAKAVLSGMASLFVVIAAFAGGMNLATDVVAGERERKSLLPLLLNGVPQRVLLLGKWAAVSCFSAGAIATNLLAFDVVFGRDQVGGLRPLSMAMALTFVCGLLPLAMLASAIQVAVSTVCRSAKEAQTYLSMLLFVPMGLGMFAIFSPATSGWGCYAPVLGQRLQVERSLAGAVGSDLNVMISGLLTLGAAAAALGMTAKLLRRDDVVYGE